jgi:hypothetical protein
MTVVQVRCDLVRWRTVGLGTSAARRPMISMEFGSDHMGSVVVVGEAWCFESDHHVAVAGQTTCSPTRQPDMLNLRHCNMLGSKATVTTTALSAG